MADKPATTPRSVGNAILAVLFLSLGAINALTGEVLEAGVWLALGAALVVLGTEATPWAEIPLARRVVGVALLCAGIALLAVNLWVDFTN